MVSGHSGHRHHAQEEEAFNQMLERSNRFQESEVRAAIGALQLPVGSRGLDVGCGVGLYALWLAEAIGAQGRVVGLDHSAERIKAARRLAGKVLGTRRLQFRQGDAAAIEEADHTFDWVWCADALHHIDEPVVALKEFARVLRPAGRIIIKESQVLHALYLPGYPELERQFQRAEIQYHEPEAGSRSFQQRRQQTRTAMLKAGFAEVHIKTYLVERQAPLDDTTRSFIQNVVFERYWGERIRDLLDRRVWEERSALCEADSPNAILSRPDYYCIYPFSLFTTRLPSAAAPLPKPS